MVRYRHRNLSFRLLLYEMEYGAPKEAGSKAGS